MAKVLIVDDSPTIVAIFQRLFARAGHEVFTARDGRSGLDAARQQRPDLIVLDCILPDLNGVEVCRTLKGDEQTKSVKVMMLTGNTDQGIEEAGKQAGVDVFLTKYTTPAQLIEAAGKLLG